MNWSAFPYLRIAIALAIGIFIVDYFGMIPYPGTLLVLTFLCYLVSEKINLPLNFQSLIRSSLLIMAVMFLGAQLYSLKINKLNNINSALSDSGFLIITGKISEKLKSGNTFKYLLETELVNQSLNNKEVKTNIIISFSSKDTSASNYRLGDRIIFKSKLKPISKSSNPEAFDYRKFLMSKGIMCQGYVTEKNHFLIKTQSHNIFRQIAENTANFTEATLIKYFKDSTAIGIAEALLIGRKLLISEEIRTAYVNTGAIHVLSVSGLHVAIFISVFIWLFERINKKGRAWLILKTLSLITIVWFYVVLTGMSPSVVRAGVMVSMYIVGKNFFKNTNTYNLLSLAAIIMLIYNPLYLFQASFQFSYISLLSILYFQPKIKSLWTPPNKFLTFIWNLITVSIAAQILIFPFTVYFFHQFPVYFIISGLIAVPLVTVIIYIGTFVILMEAIFSPLNHIFAYSLESIITFLNKIIHSISSFPYSVISEIWINDFSLFLMIISIICLIIWMENRLLQAFYLSVGLMLVVISNISIHNILAAYQRKIVMYETFGGFIIDIYEGSTLKIIKSENITDKSESFATSNHRIKHRIKNVIGYNENLYKYDDQLFYFYDNYEDFKQLTNNLNIKILFVTNAVKNSPQVLLNKIKPEIIVLDSNLKPWIREKWLTLRSSSKIKIHDIKYDGAYTFTY